VILAVQYTLDELAQPLAALAFESQKLKAHSVVRTVTDYSLHRHRIRFVWKFQTDFHDCGQWQRIRVPNRASTHGDIDRCTVTAQSALPQSYRKIDTHSLIFALILLESNITHAWLKQSESMPA